MKKDNKHRTYNNSRPLLRVTQSEKNANDKEWYKSCADYYGRNARFHDTKKTEELDMLYKLFNNKIDSKLFQKTENPLNSTNDDYKHFPSEIRPFNILRTLIERLHSEFKARPKGFQIEILNEDSVDHYKEEVMSTIRTQIEAIWKAGIENDEPSVLNPDELDQRLSGGYMDNRAKIGTTALKYIKRENNIDDKFIQAMFHYLIAGVAISYKDVINEGDIHYEIINPKHFDCERNDSNTYIEDANWASCIRFKSITEIQDLYYDELSDDDLKKLDELKNVNNGTSNALYKNYNAENDVSKNALIEEVHVTWKAFVKVGFLTYIDELGATQVTEVDETYVLNPEMGDIKLDWKWLTEVYECTIINSDIYLRMRPIIAQRNRVNRKSSCKLPYNGRFYSNVNAPNVSIMRLGVPYQVLYIIIMYKIEMELAMDMGKVLLLPQSAIPTTGDWDEEKFFYYMKSMGVAIIDESKVRGNFNQYSVLDGSRLNIISQLVELATWVERRFKELLGVTPQREGAIKASELVGNTQRSISMSYMVTEKTFSDFEEFMERDLIGLLDLSKYAWHDGLKAMYMGDDLRNTILEIDPIEYTEMDFGLIPTNASKSLEVYQQIRENIQGFAQNGATPLQVLEMLDAESISQLRIKLTEHQTSLEKRQAQAQESEQTQIQQVKEMEMQMEQIKKEFDMAIEQLRSDTSIKVAEIQANGRLMQNVMSEPSDMNGDGVIDKIELAKFQLERDKVQENTSLKVKELAQKNNHKMIDAKLKIIEQKNKLAIEQLKSTTALKNKVSGE